MTRLFERLAILLAALLAVASYLLAGFWAGAILALLLGALWMYTAFKRVRDLTSLYFGGFAILFVFLAINAVFPLLDFVGFVVALAAWDLSRFARRQESLAPTAASILIERIHLKRLGLVLGIGAILGLASILIHLRLGFAVSFFLGLFAIFATAYGINSLVKPEIKKRD